MKSLPPDIQETQDSVAINARPGSVYQGLAGIIFASTVALSPSATWTDLP